MEKITQIKKSEVLYRLVNRGTESKEDLLINVAEWI